MCGVRRELGLHGVGRDAERDPLGQLVLAVERVRQPQRGGIQARARGLAFAAGLLPAARAAQRVRRLSDEPNYWWPEDRAWCVCTDTDFDWAYLAGPAACIDEVISVPLLDAYATTPDNPAHSGMDVINDPGGTVPRQI